MKIVHYANCVVRYTEAAPRHKPQVVAFSLCRLKHMNCFDVILEQILIEILFLLKLPVISYCPRSSVLLIPLQSGIYAAEFRLYLRMGTVCFPWQWPRLFKYTYTACNMFNLLVSPLPAIYHLNGMLQNITLCNVFKLINYIRKILDQIFLMVSALC